MRPRPQDQVFHLVACKGHSLSSILSLYLSFFFFHEGAISRDNDMGLISFFCTTCLSTHSYLFGSCVFCYLPCHAISLRSTASCIGFTGGLHNIPGLGLRMFSVFLCYPQQLMLDLFFLCPLPFAFRFLCLLPISFSLPRLLPFPDK